MLSEESVHALVTAIALGIEVFGVLAIVIGGVLAGFRYLRSLRGAVGDSAYHDLRRSLGRAILLGLEFLVAADIVRTVAVDPNFRTVGVLGAIVVIRTFLSFSLGLEIDGHLPWKRPAPDYRPPATRPSLNAAPFPVGGVGSRTKSPP